MAASRIVLLTCAMLMTPAPRRCWSRTKGCRCCRDGRRIGYLPRPRAGPARIRLRMARSLGCWLVGLGRGPCSQVVMEATPRRCRDETDLALTRTDGSP